MTRLHAHASAMIDAAPEDIYHLLADYESGHPRILPQKYFRDLTVEEGGYGAGTMIRFVTVAAGKKTPYRMAVSEPEPGRVLVESDTAPGSALVTTFTVTPVAGGQKAHVEIGTEWESRPGFTGLMERLFYPMGMRRIYKQELGQLATVIAERASTPVASAASHR